MSKTFPITKLSVFFVLCSLYLFSFAHLGAYAYDRFISPNEAFSEGTRIGNIDVSTLSYQEAEAQLNTEIDGWKGNHSLTVSYMETFIPVDSKLFHFDLAGSLQAAAQGGDSPLLVSIKGLPSFLASHEVDTGMIDMEALNQEMTQAASNLDTIDRNLPIEDFFIQSDSIELISEVNMEGVPITPGLQNLLEAYPKIEIGKTSPFSLLEFMDDEAFTGLSNQELSHFASSLYRLILPTNFEVIERHQGRVLPDDIDLGYEAYVNQEQGDDFIFTNPNNTAYTITFSRQGDTLTLTLTGVEMPYEITVEERNEQTFKPKLIKQYSPYVNKGEVKVKEEGRDGMKIEVWRSFETKNGEVLKEERVSEDFYLPVYKEEIHSMKDYVVSEPQAPVETDDNGTGASSDETAIPGSSGGTENTVPSEPIDTGESELPENAGDENLPPEAEGPLSDMK
ncbi:hypothetical protein CN378_15435 [Bacillus sp. AFS015802]|uniref:VanW family protein n=1 Tax=Bacillus sp. AFS015802 TaxID=2033486 RepID=UPI000BF365A3|nr:VanW family protein [Bacillus sp. AFS015802]PFA64572.1 hypothetical protein CN378_15435 [Bacillus sp. AFS015802]